MSTGEREGGEGMRAPRELQLRSTNSGGRRGERDDGREDLRGARATRELEFSREMSGRSRERQRDEMMTRSSRNDDGGDGLEGRN